MDYAVVEIAGKQYTVKPGQTVDVDLLDKNVGESIDLPNVVFYAANGETKIGAPYVDGVTVQATVVAHRKLKKIHVLRFKAKSHYHKATGHRRQVTQLAIANSANKKTKA